MFSGTATVNYEVSPDGGTTWVSVLGALVSASSTATSTTSSGCWMFDVGGFSQIRARISGIAGGTVNVTGYAAVLSGSGGISSGGGGGNVNLTQINGTTVVAGNGTTGSGSQRVTIASDNTPFATIVRGDTKGSTSAANATVSSVDADHNALDVYLKGGALSLGAGTTATYMASDVDFAPAASAGDIWTMFGSSSGQ